MQKILPILLLMALVTINVWSFDVKSSKADIKQKVTDNTTTDKVSYVEYVEGDISYAKMKDYEQYMYTNNATNDVEWWFTYELDGANVADVVINFSFTSDLTACPVDSTADTTTSTDLAVFLPNGDKYSGTIAGVPCQEPSADIDMTVNMDDGSTGTLTYAVGTKEFSIASN